MYLYFGLIDKRQKRVCFYAIDMAYGLNIFFKLPVDELLY